MHTLCHHRSGDSQITILFDDDQLIDYTASKLPDLMETVVRTCVPRNVDSHVEIVLSQVRGRGSPYVSSTRGVNHEYFVNLDVDGAHLWCQNAYQFAHEFVHVLCYPGQQKLRHQHRNQWFEEAICDGCALYCLYEMPQPEQFYPSQPRAFADYADSQRGKQIGADDSLRRWYRRHRDSLQDWHRVNTDHSRHLQGVVSRWFLDTIGMRRLLECVRYLNMQRRDEMNFKEYLLNWRERCRSDEQKETVTDIIHAFFVRTRHRRPQHR